MPEPAQNLDDMNRQLEEAQRHFDAMSVGAERVAGAMPAAEPSRMATGEVDPTLAESPGFRRSLMEFEAARSHIAQMQMEGVPGLEEAVRLQSELYRRLEEPAALSAKGQREQQAQFRMGLRDLGAEVEMAMPEAAAEAAGPSLTQIAGMARGGPAAVGGIAEMIGANAGLIGVGAVAVVVLEKVKQQMADMSDAAERLTAGPLGGVSQSFASVAEGMAQTFQGRPFAGIASFQQAAMQLLDAASVAGRGIPAEISAMGMGGWDPMTAGGTQRAFDILGGPGAAARFGEFGNRPEFFGARAGAIYGAGVDTPTEALEAASRRPMTLSIREALEEQFVWGPEMANDVHRLAYLAEEDRERAIQLLTRGERMTTEELGKVTMAGLEADVVMQDWRMTQAQAISDLTPAIRAVAGMERDITGLVGGSTGIIGRHGKALLTENAILAALAIPASIGFGPMGVLGFLGVSALSAWMASHWGEDPSERGDKPQDIHLEMSGERVGGGTVGRAIAGQRARAVVLGG